MRWVLVVVLVAVAAQTAVARPRPDMDFFDREAEPPRPCSRAKTWPDAKRCLDKAGTTTVMYETDVAKVVAFVKTGSKATNSEVLLYAKLEAGWTRTAFSVWATPTSELLRVDKLVTPHGDGVRIDIGTSQRTSFGLHPAVGAVRASGSVRGVLRRTISWVCAPSTWNCNAFVTQCEAYVHGKVYWTFHGELLWHQTLGVRMRGATTAAGGTCTPPSSLLLNDDG